MSRTPLNLAAAALVGALPLAVPVTAAAPAAAAAAECGATLSDYVGDISLDSQFTGTLATGMGPVDFSVTPRYLPNVVRVVAGGALDAPPNEGVAKTEPPATGTPATGTPTAGTPASGAPAAGAPAAGASASGAPEAGVPATGTPATGAPATDEPPADGSAIETNLTVRQTGNGRQGVVFQTPRGEAESDGVLCSDADTARPTRVVEITGTVWSGGDGLQEFTLKRS